MAKKGKVKISKVKRNNQTTNKMKKQGKLKLQRHRNKIQKQKEPQQQPQVEYSSESEASADEWADMLDEEEQKYIASRIAKQPQLLAHVPQEEKPNKARKRKREKKGRPVNKQQVTKDASSDSGAQSDSAESDIEDKYEQELTERPVKRLKQLLPIKTKDGLQERTEEIEDTDSDDDRNKEEKSEESEGGGSGEEGEQSDSGMEGTGEEAEAHSDEEGGSVVTAVQLAAARRDRLRRDRLRIGALCSSLLECPEKKLKNLFPVLYLMEDRLTDGTLNLHSVRKLATVSACEVLRDILPEYAVRHQDYSGVKLKKETLALYKYEKELLEFYKRYLQRVEKVAMTLRRKKGDRRKPDEATKELALLSLKCMCDLLSSKFHFNYATNIAQSVVPFLDSREARARQIVTQCCSQVFADDKKGEITLVIVRLINQLSRRRGERLHPEALSCLLTLKIRDVDLDAEADIQRKKKQDEKHKKRIVNLSKKEKKRQKKLKEVERELLETEAQENEAARRRQLTEVVKTVFHVYFRLLKTRPPPGLLAAALDGIAKFTHAINLEYYCDLVAILSHMLADDTVSPRSRLQCVRAALAVLAGAGDALNVDPAGLHAYLYQHMLDVHAGSTHTDAPVVLEAAQQVCARSRRVSAAVQAALAKRLAALATQLLHNGALGALAIVTSLVKHNKALSGLLEPDAETGSGRYDPLAPSPEHCNALAAALYELCVLTRHYHPVVRRAAAAILSGDGKCDELHNLSPIQLFETYDGSEMAFKPAVPPPKAVPVTCKSTSKSTHHSWMQPQLKEYCEAIDKSVDMTIDL